MTRGAGTPADAAAAGGAAGGLDAIPEGEANQAVDLRQYVVSSAFKPSVYAVYAVYAISSLDTG